MLYGRTNRNIINKKKIFPNNTIKCQISWLANFPGKGLGFCLKKIKAPTEYIIPPKSMKRIEIKPSSLYILKIKETEIQPMARYPAIENHFGIFVKKMALIIILISARPHMTPKMLHPRGPLTTTKQKGV